MDGSYVIAVFDLQALLQCPWGDISRFYYVSKINGFNFIICDLGGNDMQCFTDDETEAKYRLKRDGNLLVDVPEADGRKI